MEKRVVNKKVVLQLFRVVLKVWLVYKSGVLFFRVWLGRWVLVMLDRIEIIIVVIIDEVIWWKVLLVVVLWLNLLIGMVFMVLVIVVIKIREILNIWMVYKKMIRIFGVVVFKKMKGRFFRVKMVKLVIVRLWILYWLKR